MMKALRFSNSPCTFIFNYVFIFDLSDIKVFHIFVEKSSDKCKKSMSVYRHTHYWSKDFRTNSKQYGMARISITQINLNKLVVTQIYECGQPSGYIYYYISRN